MANIYGQPPYFDNTTPDFPRIGETVDNTNAPNGSIFKTIKYGGPFYKSGIRKSRSALRRHIYQYNINNGFVFYKTYKGVRKLTKNSIILNVKDVDDLNQRSLSHSTETNETEPVYITNALLNSIFNFPSNNDYFFVEVSLDYFKAGMPSSEVNPKYYFANIYRYGKITQNNVIIVCKENGGSFMQ
jgi:hypothetical protein